MANSVRTFSLRGKQELKLIQQRAKNIRDRIEEVCRKAGRSGADVRIVCSSGSMMVDPVLQAVDAGFTDFSEDFLPEGITKMPPIKRKHPNTVWHFSGTLPPKKIELAVEFFDWIHTFDRKSLIRPFAEAFKKHPQRRPAILVEVNPVGVRKRTGANPSDVRELIDGLLELSPGVPSGLSCRFDQTFDRESLLKWYGEIRDLHERLIREYRFEKRFHLAIGSSRDMEEALTCGATMLRLGAAVFGRQTYGL